MNNQTATTYLNLVKEGEALIETIKSTNDELANHWHEQTSAELEQAIMRFVIVTDLLESYDEDALPYSILSKANPIIEARYVEGICAR